MEETKEVLPSVARRKEVIARRKRFWSYYFDFGNRYYGKPVKSWEVFLGIILLPVRLPCYLISYIINKPVE